MMKMGLTLLPYLISALLFVTISIQALNPPPDMILQDVFTRSEGSFYCFRMPSLFLTSRGTLLAFAEGRGQHSGSCSDTSSDVTVVVKRSRDGGKTWSSLSVILPDSNARIGNPAPIEDVMTTKVVLLVSWNMKQVLLLETSNEGETWSDAVDITSMVTLPSWSRVAPGMPGGIQLPSGRLIVGAYYAMGETAGSFAIYSDNGGKMWQRSAPIGDSSSEECQIAPLGLLKKDGPLLIMTARSPVGHYLTYSNDSGESWFNLSMPTSLSPQADCGSSIMAIPYTGVYMDTHLYTTQPYSLRRENITFFHSVDGGKKWKADFQLWKGPSGYSSMAHGAYNLRVLCLFECGVLYSTEKIALATFSPLI